MMGRGSMIRIHRSLALPLGLLLMAAAGCGKMSSDYGTTKGNVGRTSLNGFGALRDSYANAGFRTRDVSRLTDRVMRTDVIVWTPQMLTAVDSDVTRWFERWLSRGNRTLVYIVPDSGSEADYWSDAARLAPPPQRLEYRKRAARSINERMMWRMNRSNVASNGWFRVEPLVQRHPLGEVTGEWKDDFGELTAADANVGVEFNLVAFDPDNNPPAAAFNPGNAGPTGPGAPQWSFPSSTTPTATPIRFRSLLETGSGNPIVAEIGSKRWRNSRILVVSGGSLLTNYAYTRPFNRSLAAKVIDASAPANVSSPTAGFLTSSWNQIPVSERKAGVPEASGMELLTVWPISLVTMHGLMLGLVICLMLFPIFGRPHRVRRTTEREFGHHLDAVAALMNKSGGERYARMRISEYFKRMHGETSGPWVLPEPAPAPAPPSAPGTHTLKPKQLSSRRPGSGEYRAPTSTDSTKTAASTPSTGPSPSPPIEPPPTETDEADR